MNASSVNACKVAKPLRLRRDFRARYFERKAASVKANERELGRIRNPSVGWVHGKKFINGFMWRRIKGQNSYLVDLRSDLPNLHTVEPTSRLCVAIMCDQAKGKGADWIAKAGIRFEEGKIFVETIKAQSDCSAELDGFKAATGTTALDFLMQEIEEQGKALGYKEVYLVKPDHVGQWYKTPWPGKALHKVFRKSEIKRRAEQRRGYQPHELAQVESKLRDQITKTYDRLAENRHYQETAGPYRVKKL